MATYNVINYKMPTTTYKAKEYDEKQGAYASQIANAQRLLNQQLANQPSAYQSLYQNQIDSTISSIANRKPFSYDINADALYQQYKDQYTGLGKQAMADTIGQASALTGGYGNSYAVTAGNQAYQGYLSKLNEIVPQLYENAYNRYQNEGNDLYNQLSMYQNQDALDYGKYQDAYANWQNNRNYYSSELATLRGLNQDAWAQNESNRYNANNLDWNNYYNAQDYNLESYKQAVAEDQWNAEFAENQRQFNANLKEEQRQFNASQTGSVDKSEDNTNSENLYTKTQYAGWQNQVGMNRSVEGRCYAIEQAYLDGKITSEQALETMKKFGISEEEFAKIRGI